MKNLDKAVVLLAQADKASALDDKKDALSTIYDLSARLIFSTAYAVTGNYQDAEDVLQDTFLDISKYAHRFTGKGAKTWILTITRHLAINVLRKRRPTVELDETMKFSDDYSNLEVFDMLNRLDDDERQIVTYRVYAKMPYKEIAAIMEMTVANAQKKYQRAILKLREEYSHDKIKKSSKPIGLNTVT